MYLDDPLPQTKLKYAMHHLNILISALKIKRSFVSIFNNNKF